MMTVGAAADGKIGNRDPDTPVTSLNGAEWKAACVDISNALAARALVHGPCILDALLGTVLGADCMDTYALCVETTPDIECDQPPTPCDLTLREVDTCLNSILVSLAEQTRAVDCTSSLDVFFALSAGRLTPECRVAADACPGLLDLGPSGGSPK
jgi:hypothetical protein